jgi:hypothetical protein
VEPGPRNVLAVAGFGTPVDFFNGNGSYDGVQDTTIRATDPDAFEGGSTSCIAGGLTNERACLMSFDVTSIPSGAKVLGASLNFKIVDKSTRIYELFELKKAWSGSSGTTWNSALLGTPWATPGAKGSADREATSFGYFTPSALGSMVYWFDSAGLELVQRWVTQGPSVNRGFVIARADVSDGFMMASSESPNVADRPRLRVYYCIP